MKLKNYGIIILTLFLLLTGHLLPATGSEKWTGVDESVVEKFAKEHGRDPEEPLINTEQGDLLLFVFLIAGAIGGFITGYYWRILTEARNQKRGVRTGNIESR